MALIGAERELTSVKDISTLRALRGAIKRGINKVKTYLASVASVPLNVISLKETERQRDSLDQHIEMFQLIQYQILDLMEVQKENIEVEEAEAEDTQHINSGYASPLWSLLSEPMFWPENCETKCKTSPAAQ